MAKRHPQFALVAVSKLKPAAYNPRTISDEARARLKRGIERFGLVEPILIRRKDGLVIGGHQRLAIALELKLKAVPVVYLEDLNDRDAKALNVLLNNPSAQGAWDAEKLSSLVGDLAKSEYDLDLLGFPDDELKKIQFEDEPAAKKKREVRFDAKVKFEVTVVCASAKEQKKTHALLTRQGFNCQAIGV